MIQEFFDMYVGSLPTTEFELARYYGSVALAIIGIVAVLYVGSLVIKKLLR